MKKYLLIALFLLGSLAGISKVEAKSLYDCYQSKGLKWTSVLGRAGTAAEHAVWKYRGTAEQNKLLSSRLCPVSSEGEELLGFSVISGYEKNLRVSMDTTQTFVPVTSIVLKDGTTIVTSTFGGVIFLTIEPGTTREELVLCTGINSTPNFTPCTRGLAFSGTSTASVSTNRKTHNAGSKVVASNAHYVYEQFVDTNNKSQTIQGDKTATGTWTFTSGTIYIASSSFGLRVSNGMLQWSIDGFVNSYNFTSSTISQLVASSTAGINVTNNQIAVIVSTTLGGAFGPDGRYYQKTSSTLAVENDGNGIKINTSTLVNLIATGTPTGLKIPISDTNGKVDSWVTPVASSTSKTVNALTTGNDYYTYQMVMITTSTDKLRSNNWINCGFNDGGSANTIKMGGFASTTFLAGSGGMSYACRLFSSSSEYAIFNDPNTTTIKFRARVFSSAEDDVSIGVATSTGGALPSVQAFQKTSSTAYARAVFVIGSGQLASLTSNNSAVTKNVITGITTSNWNTYAISYSSTTVQFFVNEVLKFTHTTNLPSTGSAAESNRVHFGFGTSNGDAVSTLNFTDPVISVKI